MIRRSVMSALAFLIGGIAIGGLLTHFLIGISTSTQPRETFTVGFVRSVVDGDTIVLDSGERLRYVGVDTPESFGEPECGADEATALNRQLVEGRLVELLPGPQERDEFGRLLRYVFAEGVFVNAELVREGMARAQSFHSEERFAQVLVQLEVAARNASRGSWEDCDWK